MDLVQKHPFTKALLELGLGLQTEDSAKRTLKKPSGPVTVSITRLSKDKGGVILHKDLHADYTSWITQQHNSFDIEAVFNGGVIIPTQEQHKQDLNITNDVFRVVYDIQCKNIDWKVGKEESPIRLKLLKGLPGLKNNDTSLYVTVECFISEGLPDEKGDTKIICRPIEVPEEQGSKVEGNEDQDQLPCFILGKSRSFPIEILFTDKYEVVEEAAWLKREEVIQNNLPAFVELLNEQEVLKLAGLTARSISYVQGLRKNTTLKAGAALQQELIAVVRPKACMPQTLGSAPEGPRVEQKYIFAESMEMKLEVFQVKTPPRSQGPVFIVTTNPIRKHETKTAACTRGGLKGLYCFRLIGTELESFLRTSGTYILIFTLVSEKYQEVKKLKFRVDITPSSEIGHWKLCSHSGICSEHHPDRYPEVMKVRLGGVLPGTLYLTRVDEFSNPMEFTKIPNDIKCDIYTVEGDQVEISVVIGKGLIKISDDHLSLEIPRIELGGGKLELLNQTMRAALKMSIDGNPIADFSIAVLPGQIAVARMKESTAPINRLQPGQVIEHIIFEVLDSFGNLGSSGEKIRVLLQGLKLQDKDGHQRSVDANGCLDLGMRLRVSAGYGETALVELRSTEELSLCITSFDIINRKLQIENGIPERVAAGSQLREIVIEAVDEDGQVDNTMDGTAHILTLDWNPNIVVPLQQGRCTLPPIQIPHTPGAMWKGCVAHTKNPELQLLLTVKIEASEEGGDESKASENLAIVPLSLESPAVLTHHCESRDFRKQAVRELPFDHETRQIKANLQDAVDRNEHIVQKLEEKLQKLNKKAIRCDAELERLKQVKKDHDRAMTRYQCELGYLEKGLKVGTSKVEQAFDPAVEESHNTFQITEMQMKEKISELGNPPGTHAAAILLRAQRERYSEIKDTKGIVGIVALLGAVEREECNRALVEFLGLENMLAIVCESRSAAECLGIPPLSGSLDENTGLFGFVKSRNLKISGRYRVITLDESSFYKGLDGTPPVNDADPQKPLNMRPVSCKPGSERLVGSLGYAVNLIHLNEDQLKIRILGRGLRESLFFVLFDYLEVFDTRNNMLRARRNIRSAAVSLDGGLIRKIRNQYELGSREDPVVWFPAVQQHISSTSMQTHPITLIPRTVQQTISINATKCTELKKKQRLERQRYLEGGTDADIQKCTAKLNGIKKRIAETERQINDIDSEALKKNVAEVHGSIPAAKLRWA